MNSAPGSISKFIPRKIELLKIFFASSLWQTIKRTNCLVLSLRIWRLHRCWWQIMETVYLGDNFEIWVTDSFHWKVNNIMIHLKTVTIINSIELSFWILNFAADNNEIFILLDIRANFLKIYNYYLHSPRKWLNLHLPGTFLGSKFEINQPRILHLDWLRI